MTRKSMFAVLCCALLIVFTSILGFAQTQATTGVIQGKVEDPAGAMLAGATVEAKNLETNFHRESKTDSDGRFVFLALPPGHYTVKVSGSKGFANLEQTNLNLTVGQAISLNLQMKISQGTETVIVTETPLVDTVKTESSSTLDTEAISTTPVLGRKFEDLLTLSVAAVTTMDSSASRWVASALPSISRWMRLANFKS